MSDNIFSSVHPDYKYAQRAVQSVRDAMGNEIAIKNSSQADLYLPNPSEADDTSKCASARYAAYKARAEFPSFTSNTHDDDMGALNAKPNNIILPDDLEYMLVNSDGCGLSLDESIEITESNILQVKFHCLLGDFNGASAENGEQITKAEAERLGLRYTIKHYPRESFVDWQYSVFNNVKKLSYVKLLEESSVLDPVTFERTIVKNLLILGLDENGEYFQQVRRESEDKDETDFIGEKVYPENSQGRLDFIPFLIVQDQKESGCDVPKNLGKLYPVALKAIYRYQVMADLKEMLFYSGQPTTYSTGWTNAAYEMYKQITGKDYFEQGARSHIPLPEGATIGYLEFNADTNGLFKYLDENQKEVQAIGGKFPTNANDEAVGVAKMRRAEDLTALTNIANSVEEAYQKLLVLGMTFTSNSQNFDAVQVKLNKVFDEVKIMPAEIKEIRENYNMGLIPKPEALSQLERGGVLTDTAENILNTAELAGE